MSTAKHTPGPWSLSEETLRDGLKSKLVHGMPEGMLAIVRTENQGTYYGDANARLIAAAPDLLATLKSGNFTYLGDEYVVCLKAHVVEAAIAKAEGRS